jgi:hypothetical protein
MMGDAAELDGKWAGDHPEDWSLSTAFLLGQTMKTLLGSTKGELMGALCIWEASPFAEDGMRSSWSSSWRAEASR